MIGGDAREYAAIDGRNSGLRQGVLGMPGAQHGRHTGGPGQGIVPRVGAHQRHLLRGRLVHANRCQGRGKIPFEDFCGRDELVAGHLVGHVREGKYFQPGKPRHQLINRVVGPGNGGMAAGIAHREIEGQVHFLRGLDHKGYVFAALHQAAGGVGVEREFGLNQIAAFVRQPVD